MSYIEIKKYWQVVRLLGMSTVPSGSVRRRKNTGPAVTIAGPFSSKEDAEQWAKKHPDYLGLEVRELSLPLGS